MSGRTNGLLTALVLCYFTISNIVGQASSCIPEERDALLAFKAGVADPGDKLRSWQHQDCCNWNGVACSNKTLHVIRLDVSQYGLKGEGEINSSLAALTRLAYLDLSDNNFGGLAIPEFVGSFKKLRYLDLSRAYFGGKVPPQLGNLSTLEHIDLNSFGSSPTIRLDSFLWVSRLTLLTYLDLGWVYLATSSDWLQALSKLPSLKVLHLNDAFLPATDLNSVSHVNFTDLTVLNLTNNELNSCLPNWIWGLNSLSYLDLSGCQLSGLIPYKIENLTSLELLQLRNNHLNGEIPQATRRLCSLKYIDLSMNSLYGHTAAMKNLFFCMKQLHFLNVGNNNVNGSLSGWLEDLTSVSYLDISNNLFYGKVPESIGKLPNLTYLDLSFNAFDGIISEIHFGSVSSLEFLSLASNNLKIAIEPKWMPPFQLRVLGLRACQVGPYFPYWLRSQTKIEMVDLGSTDIAGTLPDWLWNFSSSITSLDLSKNSITGRLPTSLEQMKALKIFNMRSNNLVGGIPRLPDSVQMLDLSGNRLSGRIPTYLCRMALMESILLSSNSFSGVLPDCWHKASQLQTIDFSRNKFHGEIPSTMVSITSLAVLYLSDNGLTGNLPTSLKSCNRLIILDLAHNNLSGEIPTWMGDSQQSLLVLLLRSNQFSGEIPEQLFQLHDLRLLDLADNNLSGPVPLSLGSLTAMSVYQEGFKEYAFKFPQFKFTTVYDGPLPQVAVHIATGSSDFDGGLLLLFNTNFIDLSGNQLTGEIPKEIGALSCLVYLNLSGNHISGIIPDEIGNLRSLEALDLSQNGLSGPIPWSLANLGYLEVLNLSYNYLSGRIPAERQFVTFSDSSFLGNANLCGPPLSRICLQHNIKHENNRKHWYNIDGGAYLCAMLGFAYGLSVVSAILLFSATARKAYFQFTDSKLEELRTVVEIKLNRFKAGRCRSMEARRVSNQDSITCYVLEFGSPAPGD